MKKAISLSMMTVAAVFTIATGAKAQQKGFYIGAQGGNRLSYMFNQTDADKPGVDYKARHGYAFGVSAGYNFNKRMGIGTEFTYSSTRQHYIDSSSKYTQKFKYLKVPVMFTYISNPEKKFMFTAKLGPQVGLLLDSKIKNATNSQMNGNTKDQYEKITFGAAGGAGVRMRVVENIYVDAMLHLDASITNAEDKDYKYYTAGRSKTYDLNSGLELGVKYFF